MVQQLKPQKAVGAARRQALVFFICGTLLISLIHISPLIGEKGGLASLFGTSSSRRMELSLQHTDRENVLVDPRLKCVKIGPGLSKEGIGAIIKRTQLGLFLASISDVPVQYPVHSSKHGYSLHELFGLCPGEKHPTETRNQKIPDGQRCTLYNKDLVLDMCPRADCRCLYEGLSTVVKPLLDDGCSVIQFQHSSPKTLVYSGCLSRALNRYLVGDMPKPVWEYDVIHYRMGDLADKPGGKSFSPFQLKLMLEGMMKHSDRDIVIVTEGEPEIPECHGRCVLAGNTTIQEAFYIFRYAKNIGVGCSGFAVALAEVARPERVFALQGQIPLFEWMDSENWTIFDYHSGISIDFGSKKLMLEYRSGHDFSTLYMKLAGVLLSEKEFEMSVPKRRWSREMMLEAKGQPETVP